MGHQDRPSMSRDVVDVPPTVEKRTIPELDSNATELVWGPSMVLLVYQMGIAHAICEQNDCTTILERVRLTGVSGGCATAGYMLASLHGIGDMRYWYQYHGRRISEESSHNGSTRNICLTSWHLSYEYWRICNILGMTVDCWTARYRALATKPFSWSIQILNTFPNAQCFADALISSAFIPFILSPYLYFYNASKSCALIDGGFTFNFSKYNPANNIVHFSLAHGKTCNRPERDGYKRIHYSIVGDTRFFRDNFGILRDPLKSDHMFEQGYKFGCANMQEIRKLLNLPDADANNLPDN